MARTVFCKKLQIDAEGLDEPPLLGPLGTEIYEHVSRESWEAWTEMSVKIVNEYHLDLSEKDHRRILKEQLRGFLGLDEGGAPALNVGTPTAEAEAAHADEKTTDGSEG